MLFTILFLQKVDNVWYSQAHILYQLTADYKYRFQQQAPLYFR